MVALLVRENLAQIHKAICNAEHNCR